MSDDFQTPPTSPAARRRRLEEPPKSPFAKAVDAIKTTPKKLAALVNQASTSVQNVVKGASSVAIGLEDLMALSVDELALILQKGREAKEGEYHDWQSSLLDMFVGCSNPTSLAP